MTEATKGRETGEDLRAVYSADRTDLTFLTSNILALSAAVIAYMGFSLPAAQNWDNDATRWMVAFLPVPVIAALYFICLLGVIEVVRSVGCSAIESQLLTKDPEHAMAGLLASNEYAGKGPARTLLIMTWSLLFVTACCYTCLVLNFANLALMSLVGTILGYLGLIAPAAIFLIVQSRKIIRNSSCEVAPLDGASE